MNENLSTTVRMVAASCFNFRGRRLLIGQEFEALNEREAREMVITGVAKRKQVEKTKRRFYKRRDMQVEE